MIFLQLEWKKMIARNFGFLSHWFLRGCFFIFVGTNAMRTDEKTNEGEVIFSLFAGFSCIFVGVVELLFGFKCAGPDDDVEAAGRAGSGGRSQTEPTLTVNLTPNQVSTWHRHTHVQRPFAPFSSELSSRTSHPALILTCRLVCTRSLPTCSSAQVAGAAGWAAANAGTVAKVANAASSSGSSSNAHSDNPFFNNQHRT